MGKLVSPTPAPPPIFWVVLNVGLYKTNGWYALCIPTFFLLTWFFSAVQSTLGYNKTCMEFNPRGGARGPLSAPRLHCLLQVNMYTFRRITAILWHNPTQTMRYPAEYSRTHEWTQWTQRNQCSSFSAYYNGWYDCRAEKISVQANLILTRRTDLR